MELVFLHWNQSEKLFVIKLPSIFAFNKKKSVLKFIYSEKATKFFEIFPLLLTVCTVVKSKVKISQNCVAFSEYMNFTIRCSANDTPFPIAIVVSKKGFWHALFSKMRLHRCKNFTKIKASTDVYIEEIPFIFAPTKIDQRDGIRKK